MCDYCLSPKSRSLLANVLPCALKCWTPPLPASFQMDSVKGRHHRKRSVGRRGERLRHFICAPSCSGPCYGSTHPSTATASAGGPFSRVQRSQILEHHFSPCPFRLSIVTARYYCWSSMFQLLSYLCKKSLY